MPAVLPPGCLGCLGGIHPSASQPKSRPGALGAKVKANIRKGEHGLKAEFQFRCEVPSGISLAQLTDCLREELTTLMTVLGTKGQLVLSAADSTAVKRKRKISVCVPVVVTASGQWAVSGCSEIPASLCQREAEHYFEDKPGPRHTVWLSGELPMPDDELCVKGVQA